MIALSGRSLEKHRAHVKRIMPPCHVRYSLTDEISNDVGFERNAARVTSQLLDAGDQVHD